MNTRNQLLCAHSTLIFAVLVAVGMFLMTGWLPPPSPALSAEQTAAIFADNMQMRIGLAITAFVSPLFLGLAVAVSAQLRRIEGPNHVMSTLQLVTAAVAVPALQFPALYWLALLYRADLSPQIFVVINDISWFLVIGAVGPTTLQPLAIGLAILGDKSGKIYPRWLGFANLWFAVIVIPGAVIPFFKTGPFAWSGLISFWTVFLGFFGWVMLDYIWTVKAIHRQSESAD